MKITIDVPNAEEFAAALNNGAIALGGISRHFLFGLTEDLSEEWLNWQSRKNLDDDECFELLKSRAILLLNIVNQIDNSY